MNVGDRSFRTSNRNLPTGKGTSLVSSCKSTSNGAEVLRRAISTIPSYVGGESQGLGDQVIVFFIGNVSNLLTLTDGKGSVSDVIIVSTNSPCLSIGDTIEISETSISLSY